MKKGIIQFIKTPTGKAVLAILRNALIVFFGVLVDGMIELILGISLAPQWKIYIIATLKIIDELLHKSGVAEKGITRF